MDTQPTGLSSGSFNVTLKNLSRALRAASTGSLFLGYSSSACSYCAVHEPAYAAYDALARSHAKALPLLARVDADCERALVSRHEVTDLPAVVLAFGNRWTAYTGPHTRRAMAAFAATQLAPPSHAVRSEAALQALLSRGAAAELLADEAAGAEEEAGLPLGRQGLGRQEHELLMLGFFNDPEGEDEEALEDFVAAAEALRRDRPDAAVRAAHVTLSRPMLEEYSKRRRWQSVLEAAGLPAPQLTLRPSGADSPGTRVAHSARAAEPPRAPIGRLRCRCEARPTSPILRRSPPRWFRAPPSVVVLVGGEDAPSGGAYSLDERDENNLDLGAWAARAALPLLAELTGGNFAACAATQPATLCTQAAPLCTQAAPLCTQAATLRTQPATRVHPGTRRRACRCCSASSAAATTTRRCAGASARWRRGTAARWSWRGATASSTRRACSRLAQP